MSFISEVVEHLYLIYSKYRLLQRILEYWGTTILPSSLCTPKSRKCLFMQWEVYTEWQPVLFLPHCLMMLCRVQSSLPLSQAGAVPLQPHWNSKTYLQGTVPHLCVPKHTWKTQSNATSLFCMTNSSHQGSNSLILGNDWCLYTTFQPGLERLLALCQEEDLVWSPALHTGKTKHFLDQQDKQLCLTWGRWRWAIPLRGTVSFFSLARALLLLSAQQAQSAAAPSWRGGSSPWLLSLPSSLNPEKSRLGRGKLFGKREMEKEKLLVDAFHCYTGNVKTGEGENKEKVKSS